MVAVTLNGQHVQGLFPYNVWHLEVHLDLDGDGGYSFTPPFSAKGSRRYPGM